MSFEQEVLEIAVDSGIKGARFYEGAMFVPSYNVTSESLRKFSQKMVNKGCLAKLELRNCGDEVSVKFNP